MVLIAESLKLCVEVDPVTWSILINSFGIWDATGSQSHGSCSKAMVT